ncbi:MAG: PQQ-dependent sugar dehydrogenase [Acidobacteria bacterium]|nr:PQQ-dependent sugar dehydrogenase [Acidobacteriota bacterium]
MRLRSLARRIGLGFAFLLAAAASASSATLPPGFTESVVASNLQLPTAMQFAPDGRLFVLEQAGRVRVVKDGALLATPFLTLQVDDNGERGLLGIAFDPDFAINQWVYLYYTVPAPSLHNRVIRVTASGDIASAGEPVTILDLDPLFTSLYHNGGAMAFGPDGKLYIGVGENVMPQLSQDMTSRFGKMLRINADGSIPTDNPFYGSAAGANRAIWALGLRNPNNFAFNPAGTPPMFINDVGEQSWEEVNLGVAGANYGWPVSEGTPAPQNQNPAHTYPRYTYFHSEGCAIVGGAFYVPATPTFPTPYSHAYFFADYCGSSNLDPTPPRGWIRFIDPTAAQPVATPFATDIDAPVDVKIGDDGALYYLARGASAAYRVQYGSSAPGIITHPADQTAGPGQVATFSVTASGTGLSYQWQRDRADVPDATAASFSLTAQAGDDGARFRVRVSNGGGDVISNEALLTVSANQAPVATMTLPVAGTSYGGGQTIAYAAIATDVEDGPLDGSAFTWQVDFHHDAHIHPFLPPTSGEQGGTFVIPSTGHTATDVWYRIHLTVRDSNGATDSIYRDVVPRVVALTVTTLPPGRPLLVDSQPVMAPHSFTSVEGVVHNIEAQNHSAGAVTYTFTGWSDGGEARHDIVTPAVDATYTASFDAGGLTAPTAFTLAANGATLVASWSRVGGATSYQLEVGTATGLANLLNIDVGDVGLIQGVVPAGTYFGRVRAVHPGGTSAPSPEGTERVTTTAECLTAPPVPANYVARAGGLLAALTWAASPAATHYLLEVGSASGLADLAVSTLGSATTFTATAPAGSYFTRVRAVNACGASAPTPERAIVLGCSPDAVVPTGLSVSTADGIVTFNWQAPLGATAYRLLVGSAPGATDVLDAALDGATSLLVSLAGVPPGTYYVRVAAVSACGVGTPSNQVPLTVP